MGDGNNQLHRADDMVNCSHISQERLVYSPRRQPNFQITRVWTKNFRSIADTSVDLDRLTVFVGPNASGKSNLLDVLRFIKDALRFDLEVAISERQGVSGIRRQESEDGQSDVEIGIVATTRSGYTDPRLVSVEYGFTLTVDRTGGFRVILEYGKVSDVEANGQDGDYFDFRIENGNLVSSRFLIPENLQQSLFTEEDSSDFDDTDLALPTLLRMSRVSLRRYYKESEPSISTYGVLMNLHRNLQNMRFYHISPNTIREPQRLGNVYSLNEDASNLASTLRDMSRERPGLMARLKMSLALLIPGVSDLDVTSVGGYLVV